VWWFILGLFYVIALVELSFIGFWVFFSAELDQENSALPFKGPPIGTNTLAGKQTNTRANTRSNKQTNTGTHVT